MKNLWQNSVGGFKFVIRSEDELRAEVESLRCQLEKTLREAADSIQLSTVRERDLSQRVHDLMNEVWINNFYLDLFILISNNA